MDIMKEFSPCGEEIKSNLANHRVELKWIKELGSCILEILRGVL